MVMDAALKRQLVATLKSILDTTNALQTGEHWLRYNKAYGNLRITSEASVKLDEVADKLLDKWKDKYSAGYILSSLTDLLGHARRDGPDHIEPLLTALEQKYQTHATRHLALIPIVGVDILTGPLEIGNVIFRQCDSACIEELKGRIYDIMGRNKAVQANADVRDIWYKHYATYFEGPQANVVALFESVGDNRKVQEQAIYETNRSIDVLKYLLPHITNRRMYTVGIKGECRDSAGSSLVVDLDTGDSLERGSDRAWKWRIEPKHSTVMADIGVFALSEILKKQNGTELEEAILQALHWYGMAQDQADEKNSLLCLITCFETFFTRDDRDKTITNTLFRALLDSASNER
jgi:hypothetical protein